MMKRRMAGLATVLILLLMITGCGRGGSGSGERTAPALTEVPIEDENLLDAVEVYGRAAAKFDSRNEEGVRWSLEGMTRIHVAYGSSHVTVFYADAEHVTAINYACDRNADQYYYAYSASAPLSERGMKDQVTEKLPVYNKVPENINRNNSSWWWISDSVADLERLYKGQNVDARIELADAEGNSYWFYCQDED